MGIVNGTTNFVLTTMAEEGRAYSEALAEAGALGYAEPDPTADVSGEDAAAKATILAGLAFGVWIDRIHTEGIEGLDVVDLRFAADLGYVVKLLAVAERIGGGVSARVHPAMVPAGHPLAAIRGATNAIFIEGPSVGDLLFAGPGAGAEPTTTVVMGDVIDAAREVLSRSQVAPRIRVAPGDVVDFAEVPTQWYVRLEVEDRPGVLAKIAASFGDAGVSIKSVRQEGRGETATVLLVTHEAPEASQRRAVAALRDLPAVRDVAATLRVQNGEP
jgi:homoserine dehydrogenase